MIFFCRKCLTPNTRPRIVFNNKKICNACVNAKQKLVVNWKTRKKQFLDIIKKIKRNTKQNQNKYDCIVPWSGGKDSSSIALKLKFEFGLNPLLVTFSPLIPNQVGQDNREEILKLGFDNIFFRPNQKISRYLSLRFLTERGNPKVAWDAGVNSLPVQVAINYNIPYIFYAEHGESEYGGLVLSKKNLIYRDSREVIEHQVGDHPENWIDKTVTKNDLTPYIYPNEKIINNSEIKIMYFGYFFKWSMFENFNYIKKNVPNFNLNREGRTIGTFTNFDSLDDKIDDLYYYMQYIKFGFGRAIRDASRLVQNKHLTRKEAIKLVRKYDGEFPKRDLSNVLEYLNLRNKEELNKIIDLHRNNEIWKKKNNKWTLINKII